MIHVFTFYIDKVGKDYVEAHAEHEINHRAKVKFQKATLQENDCITVRIDFDQVVAYSSDGITLKLEGRHN